MAKKRDETTNWYEKLGINTNKQKTNPKHMIPPKSLVGLFGSTGQGKTCSFLEFMMRSQNANHELPFERIIIFSGSTVDEPMYQRIKEMIPEVELIEGHENLPILADFVHNDDNKETEKVIVFDDIASLPNKQKKHICDWMKSARKLGYTSFVLAQHMFDLPTNLRGQFNICQFYRTNDSENMKIALRSKRFNGISSEELWDLYERCATGPGQFLTVDTKSIDIAKTYRQNFIGEL